MPPFQFDAEDCSLIVSALVHYAGDAERDDPDALRAHDIVQEIANTVGLPPSELVRLDSPVRTFGYRPRP